LLLSIILALVFVVLGLRSSKLFGLVISEYFYLLGKVDSFRKFGYFWKVASSQKNAVISEKFSHLRKIWSSWENFVISEFNVDAKKRFKLCQSATFLAFSATLTPLIIQPPLLHCT
jgi:hypothetical protein